MKRLGAEIRDAATSTSSHTSHALQSDPKFNVKVTSFSLESDPARITSHVEIAGQKFFSSITYHTIPSWDAVWSKCHPRRSSYILGALVAWDCMRFMALGGDELELCEGLELDQRSRDDWSYCLRNQFGEWRYRNNFLYRSPEFPRLVCQDSGEQLSSQSDIEIPKKERWLLTNGGGKDTLAGMILLNDAALPYDLYEGYLPTGGTWDTQSSLLTELREAAASPSELVRVTIEDDFFAMADRTFASMGVRTRHFKTDFAVGHTANYPGYFPLMLYHGYSGVWFNIEASADRAMARWNDEDINHQWCKSREYQNICSDLYRRLTDVRCFAGFASTLRGLHDSAIYAISATEEALLRKTHSCNVDKPWCRRCPKCCFSYLMMTALKDEQFAMEVMGTRGSLFDTPENADNWRGLLDRDYVAWECVPSHEECLVAVDVCLRRGVRQSVLTKYADIAHRESVNAKRSYLSVDWSQVPPQLKRSTLARANKAGVEPFVDVIVVGGGQAGLSMSYSLQQAGIAHVVVEAETIGASWLRRWNSFRLNTPNRTLALAGMQYEGSNPDGFSSKEEVTAFLRSYANKYQLPVLERSRVLSVTNEDDHYLVETELGRLHTHALIVATGEYSVPKIPNFRGAIPDAVAVMHSNDYRSPDNLKPGAVLVVGGGQSGAQIVDELHSSGRLVYWSLSDRPSNIRRLRGKDFMEWWDIGGILHRHVNDLPDVRAGKPNALRRARSMEFPLVSGIGEDGLGSSISLQELSEAGVVLLGKLKSVIGGIAEFDEKFVVQIERAVAGTTNEYRTLNSIAEKHYAASRELAWDDNRFIPKEIHSGWKPARTILQLSLSEVDISSVIFATGYRSAWPWLHVGRVLDEFSYPLGTDGVSPIAGLYFLGLFNLQRLSSTCLCNNGIDAATLLPHIQQRLASATMRSKDERLQHSEQWTENYVSESA